MYSLWELGSFIQGNRYSMRADREAIARGVFFNFLECAKSFTVMDDCYAEASTKKADVLPVNVVAARIQSVLQRKFNGR